MLDWGCRGGMISWRGSNVSSFHSLVQNFCWHSDFSAHLILNKVKISSFTLDLILPVELVRWKSMMEDAIVPKSYFEARR
jgi:hypothetical protein